MPIILRMGILPRIVMATSMIFFVLGCKKPMDAPEIIDPIYMDLLKLEKEHDALYRAKLAEAEVIKKDWESSDALSGRIKTAKAKFFAKEEEAEKERQLARYFKLRAKTRQNETRKSYMEAFNKDLPWPNPEEYANYVAENRLRGASKSWDSRVPRWNQRVGNAKAGESADKKKPEAAAAKSGH